MHKTIAYLQDILFIFMREVVSFLGICLLIYVCMFGFAGYAVLWITYVIFIVSILVLIGGVGLAWIMITNLLNVYKKMRGLHA